MAYNGSQAQAGRGSSFSIGGSSLTAPGTVTPTTATTGGALASGTYYYKVTAIDAGGGETAASPEATETTTGSTSTVGLAWTAVASAVGYKVYRGATAGGESVFFSTGTNSFTDIGGAGTSGTPPTSGAGTAVGEVGDVAFNRGKWMDDDVTNFESGSDKEIIETIRDNGDVTVSGNRVSGDAGQEAVESAYGAGTKSNFKLVLPKTPGQVTSGDTYTFSAFVISADFTVTTTKKIDYKVSLKTTGLVVFTAGS